MWIIHLATYSGQEARGILVVQYVLRDVCVNVAQWTRSALDNTKRLGILCITKRATRVDVRAYECTSTKKRASNRCSKRAGVCSPLVNKAVNYNA